MTKRSPDASVPQAMQARYQAAAVLSDDFCARHLNDEYTALARRALAALARKRPSPLASGRPDVWACAVLYAIGQLNFLSDRSRQPHMSTQDLCAGFGVGVSTGANKAKLVRAALRMRLWDHQWMLPDLIDRNPLVWMLQVNGFIVDIRDMPREAQELAFERGLIPYLPAGRPQPGRSMGVKDDSIT